MLLDMIRMRAIMGAVRSIPAFKEKRSIASLARNEAWNTLVVLELALEGLA
jgi:hypothetical protein